MNTRKAIFEVEREGDTLIVTPAVDLCETEQGEIAEAGQEILDLLRRSYGRNLVLDFHRTDYYGSTALGFFVRLWKWVRVQGGKMALCHLSDHEREILAVTGLDGIWPICASREEALAAVRDEALVAP
jgi:anti-sigma B factor antagonist